MTETAYPDDCLVLKIEEYEIDTKELDNSIFILYDKQTRKYVVRGKRRDRKTAVSPTYSFVCNNSNDLEHFIRFSVCKENSWTYILYNYDNLPADSNDISYEFLKKNESPDYEIAAYDNNKYSRKLLLKNLRMLSNVFNYY